MPTEEIGTFLTVIGSPFFFRFIIPALIVSWVLIPLFPEPWTTLVAVPSLGVHLRLPLLTVSDVFAYVDPSAHRRGRKVAFIHVATLIRQGFGGCNNDKNGLPAPTELLPSFDLPKVDSNVPLFSAASVRALLLASVAGPGTTNEYY